MTGFYGLYLLYLFLGLLFTGVLFYWAVANGQLREQDRARYLPLAGEEPRGESPGAAKWPRSLILVMVVIGSMVAVPLGVLLVMALTA